MTDNMKPLEDKLAEAQREVSQAMKKQGKAVEDAGAGEKALYRALQVVRELGDLMKDDEDLQKAFLAGRKYVDVKGKEQKVAYGKPVRKNIYIGLVKLAFSKTGKSSLSQYAKVLRLSEQDQPDASEFADWVDGEHESADGSRHGGIKGALRRAKVELLTPEERKAKEANAKADYDLAIKNFLDNATKIKAPITQFEGAARALIYFDKEAGVLYVDEYNAAKDERSVASAVKAWKIGRKA